MTLKELVASLEDNIEDYGDYEIDQVANINNQIVVRFDDMTYISVRIR